MSEQTTHPTRWLRFATVVSRLLFGLLLGSLLLFVVAWGGLHGWIVPRIGEWRGALEAKASRDLGIEVRIGAIVARTTGLIPSFEFNDVRLIDKDGHEALRLPVVLGSISPGALLRLGFDQIYIDSAVLEIRRTASGQLLVAGLDVTRDASQDSGELADWFFSQNEFAIRNATVRWIDEMQANEAVELRQVDLVSRNPGRRHLLRLDATPPPSWGSRFSLRGMFQSPLFSGADGEWRTWIGEAYAEFDQIDLAELRRHVKFGDVDLSAGRGALRVWATLQRGEFSQATADLGVTGLQLRLRHDLEPLALSTLTGRVGARRLADGREVLTEGLQFQTVDGLRWPGGNLRATLMDGSGATPARGSIEGDRLDLAALAQITSRLPLETSTLALITGLEPRGLVESFKANWQGPAQDPQKFDARGRLSGLRLKAQATDDGVGRPGLSGLDLDFDFNERGGRAKLGVAGGMLELPGVFENPSVPLDQLSADASWRIDGARTELTVSALKFANAHAAGEAHAIWRTGEPAGAGSARTGRLPGVLDLRGSLSRADGTQVHRYLPLVIPAQARHYVRDAVQQGSASDVKFRLRGNLADIPFDDPRKGEFHIEAKVTNAQFAYVPRSILPAGSLPWPALTQISGQLVFDRSSMEVRDASGRVVGLPSIQLSRMQARVPDLAHTTTVVVSGEGRTSAADALALVRESPLAGITNQVLAQASISGNADFRLRLTLPVMTIENSRVQGSITLPGNDVQFSPDTPQLGRARGLLTFSENGFSVIGAQARLLGGDARFEGGTRMVAGQGTAGAPESVVAFRGQGVATAEGLRAAGDLGLLSRVVQRASGSTAYSAYVGFRRGQPEVAVSTNLQGMALDLPAPLNKAADAVLPVRFENTVVRDSPGGARQPRDLLALDVGRLLSVQYVRDLGGPFPRVLRGGIGAGLGPGESAPSPEEGVAANIQFDRLDFDAWAKVLDDEPQGTPASASSPGPAPQTSTSRSTTTQAARAAALSYLPTMVAVRGREVTFGGRTLHNVVVGGAREGLLWRATVDASELSGYAEYRQPGGSGPGRVYARLARLNLPPSAAREVESLLDNQPTSVPALDIVVEDLALGNRKLGRVEIDAVNRGGSAVARDGGIREWRLNRLNLSVPEATLTAHGNWAAADAQPQAPGGPRPPRVSSSLRRASMTFKLDVMDSGVLLERFGMAGVIRGGKGRLEGNVQWLGSPLALDYPTLDGQVNVNMQGGQFLKADPGLAKLLGVLSLQTLPRRLALDFRDVFTEGFAFDFIRGDVSIDDGIASTNNLQMKGVNAAVLMEGSADIAKETQDLRVIVIPEINAGTASLIATVINPAVGLGSFLAQMFLRRPLIQATTQEFHVEGTWSDPKVSKVPSRPLPAGATSDTNDSTDNKREGKAE